MNDSIATILTGNGYSSTNLKAVLCKRLWTIPLSLFTDDLIFTSTLIKGNSNSSTNLKAVLLCKTLWTIPLS